MTWLLLLYPPRWRRRYGRELADLVALQPFSVGAAIDVLAGAIDAWFHLQLVPAKPDLNGDVAMIARIIQLKCAGYGPNVTKSDRVKNTAVNIAGTLVLAVAWLAAVWVVKHRQFRGNVYLMSLSPMTYLFPYLMGLHYTSLKGRSTRAQAILIGGVTGTLVALLLLAGWISTTL